LPPRQDRAQREQCGQVRVALNDRIKVRVRASANITYLPT
jgi:hypothetical protein